MLNQQSKTANYNQEIEDYSVDIFELAKSFRKAGQPNAGYSSIKTLFTNLFQKTVAKPKPSGSKTAEAASQMITAIKDLTIRIPQGASVGVIGRNGSGKSTLLKLITGIYQPEQGHVRVNGRIAALIELGAGFHPDFTGRENLYLGGVLHGLSKKQINNRFDEIVQFAELEEFIDQPVRTYSSGMFMRLGFSLAVNTDPDILLIDEVLAVGDARFVTKCQEKVAELRRKNKTLFIVSHDLSAIERWTDEVIWLEKGVVKDRGEPRRVIDAYLEFVEKGDEEVLLTEQSELVIEEVTKEAGSEDGQADFDPQRWGSREIELSKPRMLNNAGVEKLLVHTGEPIIVTCEYKINGEYKDPVFGFGITRSDGTQVIGTNTHLEEIIVADLESTQHVSVFIPALNLQAGVYYLDLAVHREDGYSYDYLKSAIKFSVRSKHNQVGILDTRHNWSFD